MFHGALPMATCPQMECQWQTPFTSMSDGTSRLSPKFGTRTPLKGVPYGNVEMRRPNRSLATTVVEGIVVEIQYGAAWHLAALPRRQEHYFPTIACQPLWQERVVQPQEPLTDSVMVVPEAWTFFVTHSAVASAAASPPM